VQASVGSQCTDCVRAAQPSRREQLRRWNAASGPVVTHALIAINVAVFVLGLVGGAGVVGAGRGDVQGDFAVYGPFLADGEWYRLITAAFVHYGLIHLGFNMFVILQLGRMLEPALGRARYLALYLAAAICGCAGATVVTPLALTAGASGAAFGLAGAAAVGLRQRGIGLMQSGIGMMLLVNFVLTFSVPGISIGGHVGGFLGGAAVGAVLLRPAAGGRSGTGSLLGDLAVAAVVVALAIVATVVRVSGL
jgi:membrane associated rhomboid family serine protease